MNSTRHSRQIKKFSYDIHGRKKKFSYHDIQAGAGIIQVMQKLYIKSIALYLNLMSNWEEYIIMHSIEIMYALCLVYEMFSPVAICYLQSSCNT